MTNWRLASWNTSNSGMRCCLSSREFAEHGTDRQSETAEVTLRKNISRHNFTGGVNIFKWPATFIEHTGSFIHGDSHIRERNSRAQWKPVKRRTINRHRPISFW